MNHREQVYTTIQHRQPDNVPKGEVDIAPRLVARLLGRQENDYLSKDILFEDAMSVRKILNIFQMLIYAYGVKRQTFSFLH
jgi:hypothetical protein